MRRGHKHSLTLGMTLLVVALSIYALTHGTIGSTGNVINETPLPRWESMPISYRIANRPDCGNYQAFRIQWALDTITRETFGAVTFQEDPEGKLVFVCNRGYPSAATGYVIQGEATYNVTNDNTITSAEVFFNNAGPNSYSGGCRNYPDVEIHEILHTFGFEHKDDPMSIMYWEWTICRVDRFKIDTDIVARLQETYPRQ